MTEQEAIRQSVQEPQSNLPSTVAWPPAGETPINEFRTEGYISCAFPTLFPTGAADFVAPRARAVTIGNYFKHLLMYEDGRFARHPCFCYFALPLKLSNSSFRFSAITNPLFHTSYYMCFRPHQPHCTSRSARACTSITFELTLAPTMLCIHLVHILV